MKKMKRMMPLIAAGLLAVASAVRGDAPAAGKPAADTYAVEKTIKIGGDGRWDYVTFDPESKLIWATRSTHTQGIDPATGKVVLDVKGQGGSHGAVAVPKSGHGFITDGRAGTFVIFDLKTGEVLATPTAADDADGLIYDAGMNLVIAGCGDAGQIAVLDPMADPKTVKAETIDIGGKPEFLAADGKGMVYVNLVDKNAVAAVDLKAKKVVATWPTGSGTGPAGLAIDAAKGRLFVGCHNKKMIVMSTDGGKILGELPIGQGVDACGFDPGTGEAFASCGDSTLTVVKETSADKFEVTQTVQTPRGSRTMTIDPATHTIYLPGAEMQPPKQGERRPQMVPGSFMIVVVNRKA